MFLLRCLDGAVGLGYKKAMHGSWTLRWLALVAVMTVEMPAYPCSWANGFFNQVTQLRGNVVRAQESSFLGVRWRGRLAARKGAELTLYEYRWPIKSRSDMPLVKSINTDTQGHFDFGPLKHGHYTLTIEDGESDDWYDVEVANLPQETVSVTVNITPAHPDCRGGHEFLVSTR